MSSESIKILLVEDDSDDVHLALAAVELGDVAFNIDIVSNGTQALDFLYKRNGFESVARPDMVLLDIQLPEKSGREVFSEIKNHPDLKSIPVVFLTANSPTSLQREFQIASHFCHTKPTSMNDYIQLMKKVEADFKNGQLKNSD